jgi:hypothetical protein
MDKREPGQKKRQRDEDFNPEKEESDSIKERKIIKVARKVKPEDSLPKNMDDIEFEDSQEEVISEEEDVVQRDDGSDEGWEDCEEDENMD